MDQFKDILFYMDTASPLESVSRVLRLAGDNEAAVTAFHVIEPHEQVNPRERMLKLEWILEPFRENGLEVELEVEAGYPYLEIIRRVLTHGHDLVIKDAGLESGFKELFFTTTDLRLLRKCPCPLLLVEPAHHEPFDTLLAAIDPYSQEDEGFELNRTILRTARGLARLEQAELCIAHSVRDENVHTGELARHTCLEEIRRAGLSEGEFQFHLLQGDPAEKLPWLVDKLNADVLIMGTVARTGLSGFIIGNTAERILRQVNCSILALKPEGFVCPVELAEE